jgi:hypothetical protein
MLTYMRQYFFIGANAKKHNAGKGTMHQWGGQQNDRGNSAVDPANEPEYVGGWASCFSGLRTYETSFQHHSSSTG